VFWTCSTHARAITNHMAPSSTSDKLFSLKISALNSQQLEANKNTTERPAIPYRPGDIIPTVIEVHKYDSFEAVSLHGSLIGETRIWSHLKNRPDIFQTIIHTHLNQSAGFSQSLPSINTTRSGNKLSIPTTFVLPELAIDSGSKSSISSRLPPSCESGSLYRDPWGRIYKQPLIEYYLQATLKYRVDSETAVRTITAKHKIRITTTPHNDPPMYTERLAERELVIASADISRSKFSKPFAKLSVAMEEPSPVVARGQTIGQLHVSWETSSEAHDEFELGKRRVEVEYQLQSRTRYGTRVAKSGENSTGDDSRTRTGLETTTLGTFEVCATDRNDVHVVTSEKQRRAHSGTISIPVQVAEGTVPSFSHTLASRDYALLMKVRVQGLQHKELSLKVPLQVCESSGADKDETFRVKSDVFAKMALSDVSCEM
jgi:hypothetical protein